MPRHVQIVRFPTKLKVQFCISEYYLYSLLILMSLCGGLLTDFIGIYACLSDNSSD
jgi:hypothetical protein